MLYCDISICFGVTDYAFAKHPTEEKNAKKIIRKLKRLGITFDYFEKEIVWYLYEKARSQSVTGNHRTPNLLQNHIETQVKRARKLWKQCYKAIPKQNLSFSGSINIV